MAIGIGPWIAPTLALICLILFSVFRLHANLKPIALIVSAGSIGGILATGFGFSYPSLYFLQPDLYNELLQNPLYFSASMMGLALAAGGFGAALANIFEHKLLVEEQLSFPIGQLVYKMISIGTHLKKAYQLLIGFVVTTLFCAIQDGFLFLKGIVPKQIALFNSFQWHFFTIPRLTFDLWPMAWAIGFIAGHMITIPLAVGAITHIILVKPLHATWFSFLKEVEFSFAFCSGMVLYGAVASFFGLPRLLEQLWRSWRFEQPNRKIFSYSTMDFLELILSICIAIIFLRFYDFSFASLCFLLFFTALFTYQIMVIAGKIGLAPLGRFATFVMVPAMFLFKLSLKQTVIVATFVEVCGGVAADILFGRKTARMAAIDATTIKRYQYLGLLTSAVAVGGVFWFITTTIPLGSDQLFAYKAQSRQLLIDAKQFDYYVLALGGLFSFCLQYMKVNPILVLGGLLMPINLSMALIFGGILSFVVKEKEEWEPFWSGVFAANSLWMVVRTVIGI